MKVEIFNQENTEVFETLVSGVRDYNRASLGSEKPEPLSVILRDEQDAIIAGVTGQTIYKHFLVTAVWADSSLRNQGLGRKVMELAETEAQKRGCIAAQVDTLSIQAPDFYKKLGFKVMGKIPGLTLDHDRYFFIKEYPQHVV